MKYEDAVRVAEKIKPWVPARQREWVAALDTLIAAGRKLSGSPTEPEPSITDWIMGELGKVRTEIRTAFDGFAEDLIGRDLSSEFERPEPRTEDPDKIKTREEVLRYFQRTAFVEGWEQARLHYGHQESDFPEDGREFHGAECDRCGDRYTLCTCDDAFAALEAADAARSQYPDPTPVPSKAGDEVPNRDAAKLLPVGTVIRDKSGLVGVVSNSGVGETKVIVVRWSEPHPSPVWPATIEWVA